MPTEKPSCTIIALQKQQHPDPPRTHPSAIPALIAWIRSQPGFIANRGDRSARPGASHLNPVGGAHAAGEYCVYYRVSRRASGRTEMDVPICYIRTSGCCAISPPLPRSRMSVLAFPRVFPDLVMW